MIKGKESCPLLPERLVNVRTNLGITKAEAARRLNLSKMGYGRYESGEREPSPQMLQVIADGLNTSVDYLVGITEDISSDKIVVYKNQSPELFELVTACAGSDSALLKRLNAYYRLLADQGTVNPKNIS